MNVALADADADRARAVKDDLGLTWEEFIVEAADALEERGAEPEAVPPDEPSPETGETPVDVDAEEIDVPGAGSTADARREAVVALYSHLREQGSASKSDFLQLVDPDEVGYQSAESFWSNAIKGRDSLQALPRVEPPAEGEHQWRYAESGK